MAHAVLSVGSCFADVVGKRLRRYRFHVICNPTGVLFNPSSVAGALRRVLTGTPYTAAELVQQDGLWHSLEHHGDFSAVSAEAALSLMNDKLAAAHRQVAQLDTLLVTFGTAFVYALRGEDRIVANCHKLPATRFVRRLLPVDVIVADWSALLEPLYAQRPELNVILTVSPVRHLRDDAHENTVSKAHLTCAVQALQQRFPNLYYFPAYEIVLDELRDYRFFAPDMAHPSTVASQYVWERFVPACLGTTAQELVTALESVIQEHAHVPLHPESVAASRNRLRSEAKLAALRTQYPAAAW